jgi:hypothetical protein
MRQKKLVRIKWFKHRGWNSGGRAGLLIFLKNSDIADVKDQINTTCYRDGESQIHFLAQ